MDRVEELAVGYIEMWDDTYRATNDKGIVLVQVRRAMSDIELWCNGADRNGANSESLSPDEALALYRHLAPCSSFYDYTPNSDLLGGAL